MSEKAAKKSLQTLKDCKRVEDVNFAELEIIRGQTPDNINDRCLQLCQQYLSGIWSQQTADTIHVQRLTGGLTNQLYHCSLKHQLTTNPDAGADGCAPREVAIRLYGSKYVNIDGSDGNERLTDIIIALLASRSRLGPNIYGLFEGGEILAYYKHRPFHVSEQQNPRLVSQVFRKLARFHAMDVPVRRRHHWLADMFDQFYERADTTLGINTMAKELECETFIEYDIGVEKEWIKALIARTDSPMVFTHNDFRSSNIMIVDNKDVMDGEVEGEDSDGQTVVFCDFDGSSYGYRGQDLGSIFFEWGRTWDSMKDLHQFPDDEVIAPVIEVYIRESERIYGPKWSQLAGNSADQMLKELKRFVLVNALFTIFTSLRCDEKLQQTLPLNPKLIMKFCEISYKNYWHLKHQFIAQNVV